MTALPGGKASEVAAWEARFATAMADFVTAFCADDAPPLGSTWHAEVEEWVRRLRSHGTRARPAAPHAVRRGQRLRLVAATDGGARMAE
jgi:hypothetical protein